MRRFLTTKGLIGICSWCTVLLVAILAPLIIPPEARPAMDMRARLAPPTMGASLRHRPAGPRPDHPRAPRHADLARHRVSAVAMSIVLGLPLGMVSGYFGGRVDNVLMRLVDALLAFPALLLALTISAVLGPNLQNTIIAIGSPSPPTSPGSSGARRCASRRCPMSRRRAHRAPPTHDPDPPRPAQHPARRDRAGHDQPGLCDSGRGGPVVPRPWHPAACGKLGPDDPGEPRLPGPRPWTALVPGRRWR
jgi:hypothetical protein